MRSVLTSEPLADSGRGEPLGMERKCLLYGLLLDQVSDAVAVHGLDGRLLEYNERYANLIAEQTDSGDESNCGLSLGPDGLEEFLREVAEETLYRREVSWRHSSGEVTAYDFRASVVPGQGAVPSCIVSVLSRVAERTPRAAIPAQTGGASQTRSEHAPSSPGHRDVAAPREQERPISQAAKPDTRRGVLSVMMEVTAQGMGMGIGEASGPAGPSSAAESLIRECPLKAGLDRREDEQVPMDWAACTVESDPTPLRPGKIHPQAKRGLVDWRHSTLQPTRISYQDVQGRFLDTAETARDISDRQWVETELRRLSQERLALAAESCNEAFWDATCLPGCVWDAPDTPIWWSSRVREILGLSADEPIHTYGDWLQLVHPHDVESVMLALRAHIEEYRPYDLVYRLRTTGGEYRWIHGRGQATWDEAGTPIRMSGSCQNITERMMAEQALRQSEERYRLLCDLSPIGMFVVCDDVTVYINQAACGLLGVSSPEGLLLRSGLDFVHPDSRLAVQREAERLFAQGGMVRRAEHTYLRRNGGKLEVEVDLALTTWEGKPAIQGVFADVGERRRAAEALRASEELFSKAFRLSPYPVVISELKTGCCLDANEAAILLFGDDPPVGLARSLSVWPPAEHRARLVSLLKKQGRVSNLELTLENRGGEARHFLVSAELIELHGRPCMVMVGHEVTEQKRAEAKLRASEARFRAAFHNAAIGMMLESHARQDNEACHVNQAFCTMLEYTNDELRHLGMAGITHPDDWPRTRALSQQLHAREIDSATLERRCIKKDGSIMWALTSLSSVRDADGSVVGTITLIQDITPSKQAEAALRASEERFAKAFRASPHPIMITELGTGKIIDANRAASEKFGYTAAEFVDRTTDSLRVWVDLSERRKFLAQVTQVGSVSDFPARLRNKEGETRDFVISSEVIELGGSRCLVTVGTDVTERLRAEKALLQVAEGVSAVTGVAFFQSLVEHLSHVLDADYVFIVVPVAGTAGRAQTVAGFGEGHLLDNFEYDLRGTPCEGVLSRAEPLLITVDLQSTYPDFALFRELNVTSYLGVPLRRTDGDMLGMIGIMKKRPFTHPPQAESLLRVFVSRAAAELERQEAEEAVRRGQANLRRITDAIPGFVYQYRVGPDGAQSFPFASRGTIDLLGCAAWELEADAQIGWRTVLPDDLEGLTTSIELSAQACEPWTHEFRVCSMDGLVRWLRGSSLPERQADGGIVWYGLFTDVTARREQERQLRFTQFAMDHAADAIVIASPDMRLVYANVEACRSLQYTQQELLQLTIADIAPQHDPNLSARLALLQGGERLHYESVHRRKDGREFPVDVSVRYLEHEGVRYTCATARDITERQMLEQSVRHADRLATLGTITAGVAHELNNPLFVITGHLQLMERNVKRRNLKSVQKEIAAAQEAASRATAIVSQFLHTAHASTGEREPCDVTLIARRAVALLRGELRSRDIAIETEFPAKPPFVSADPQSLAQVFLNLLTNARQALQGTGVAGRIQFTIDVRESEKERTVECCLRDNGPGIPAEHLPRIFDPFFTTKPAGEGTGLGLAICRRIVNELSGTLICESQVGQGAAFIVRLPLSGSERPAHVRSRIDQVRAR